MNASALRELKSVAATVVFAAALVALSFSTSLPAFAAGQSHGDKQTSTAPLFLEGSGLPETEIPLNSLAPLVKRVKPGVVNIYTLSVVPVRRQSPLMFDPMDELIREFFEGQGPTQTRQSLGSGFILNSQGLVVTNNHVVNGAARIRVGLSDGREFSAHPVGLDPKTDLALLQLEGDGVKDLPVVPLGDSDVLEVGDFALAVGNPFGLDHSVSLGIVSAKERVIGAGPYDDFIQTDTAINPGNSGGPLFNLRGEVVGVNTAIMAQGQGIGFAVPINMLKILLPQLIQGRVLRGWLGVSVQDVPATLLKKLKLERSTGAFVHGVIRGGPSHVAGIAPGDVILSVGGTNIVSYNQFSRVVAALKPRTKTSLVVLRNGEKKTVEVNVASRPDERRFFQDDSNHGHRHGRDSRGFNDGNVMGRTSRDNDKGEHLDGVDLGVTVKELSRSVRARFGIPGGVEIVSMDEDSPLKRGGVQPGDVILEMQRQPVRDLSDFGAVTGELRAGERLLIRVQRGDTSIYVAVKL